MNINIIEKIIIPIFTLFASFLLARYTARHEVKKNIETTIFEKQKDLYIRFLTILCELENNPFLQFDGHTLKKIDALQAEFCIFASEKCNKDFSELRSTFAEILSKYSEAFGDGERQAELAFYAQQNNYEVAVNMQEEFDAYKMKHKIDDLELKKKLTLIRKDIRKSLGIK